MIISINYREPIYIRMELNMKVIGKMINNTGRERSLGQMELLLKEITRMDRRVGWVFIERQTDQFMKGSLRRINLMVKGIIRLLVARDMLDNIRIIRCMERGYF